MDSSTCVCSTIRCAFCHRGQRQVSVLVSGPSVYICKECVGLAVKALHDRGYEVPIPAQQNG